MKKRCRIAAVLYIIAGTVAAALGVCVFTTPLYSMIFPPVPTPTVAPPPVDLREYDVVFHETGSAAVDAEIRSELSAVIDDFDSKFTASDAEKLSVSVSGEKMHKVYSYSISVDYPGYSSSEFHTRALTDGREIRIDELLGENIRKFLWNYFDFSMPELEDQTGELADGFDSYIADDKSNYNSYKLNADGSVSVLFKAGTINSTQPVVLTVGEDVISGEFWSTRHIRRDRPMVAITFDDGPSVDYSPVIYECLQKYHSVATFFDVGMRVDSWPEIVKQGYDLGNEMASHTYWHTFLDNEEDIEGLQYDQALTEAAFINAIGEKPKLIRPPEGRLAGTAMYLYNYTFIGWSVDTLDWLTKDPQNTFRVVKEAGDLDGQVILLHSIYKESAEAACMIIPWLVEQGYQLVTVSELLEYGYGLEEPETHWCYGFSFFSAGRPEQSAA